MTSAVAAVWVAMSALAGCLAGCRSAPMPVSQVYDPITAPRGTWTVGGPLAYRALLSDYRTPDGDGDGGDGGEDGSDGDGELVAGDGALWYAVTDRLEVGPLVARYAVVGGADDASAPRGPVQVMIGARAALAFASAVGAPSPFATVQTPSPEVGRLSVQPRRAGTAAVPVADARVTWRLGRVRWEAGARAVPWTRNATVDRLVAAYAGATAQLAPAIAAGVRADAGYERAFASVLVGPRFQLLPAERRTATGALSVALQWRLGRTYDLSLGARVTGHDQAHDVDGTPAPDDFTLPPLSGQIWQVAGLFGFQAYW